MINNVKMLKYTERYSKDFSVPDYIYKKDGSLDREKMLNILLQEEYGYIHDKGVTVEYKEESIEEDVQAGKAQKKVVIATVKKGEMSSSFPIQIFTPYNVKTKRTVVFIDFEPIVMKRFSLIEELMDMGLTIAHICYSEITSDDGDFTNGLAPILTDRTDPKSAGKIAIWSYGARITADYLLKNGIAKKGNLCVAGHSRLGKTALLTGAIDTRFNFVHSNCSGNSGAAISREKNGERIENICYWFPYWFCENYKKYINNEDKLPFDQHYLLSLIAPRKLSIVVADKDEWADTDAQYLCAELATIAYKRAGVKGLVESGGILKMGECSKKGNIVFKKRYGTHFFSREDWAFLNEIFKVKK